MKSPNRKAFTLVEVTMSIGIAAFCWLAILGLLPAGMSSHQNAVEQTTATNILACVTADLKSAAPRQASPICGVTIPVAGTSPATTTLYVSEHGEFKSSLQPDSRQRLTVVMTPPGANSYHATYVHARITWPAVAPIEHAAGSMEASFALAVE